MSCGPAPGNWTDSGTRTDVARRDVRQHDLGRLVVDAEDRLGAARGVRGESLRITASHRLSAPARIVRSSGRSDWSETFAGLVVAHVHQPDADPLLGPSRGDRRDAALPAGLAQVGEDRDLPRRIGAGPQQLVDPLEHGRPGGVRGGRAAGRAPRPSARRGGSPRPRGAPASAGAEVVTIVQRSCGRAAARSAAAVSRARWKAEASPAA